MLRDSTLLGVPVRRVIRVVWVLLSVATLSALPWMAIEFKKAQYSVHYQAWFVAGLFVVLAVSASIYEVAQHLEHYHRPRLQVRVVRILGMVPIYAVNAWLSLRFKEARFYIDPVRECYEAFVIYNFFMYLIAYLEDELGDVAAYYSTKEPVPHLWPVARWLRPWRPGAEFFWQAKRGVLSYVIVRPLATAVSVAANARGAYCEGEFRAACAYPYVALANNCTQMWALYCLVLVYQATRRELAPIRPLPKFVAIKAVVFFSFWQGVAIELLAAAGLIAPAETTTYDADDVAAGLQSFLICLEMFVAAIGHAYAFPPSDYASADAPRPPPSALDNLRVMFDVRDVMTDVGGVVRETLAEAGDGAGAAARSARGAAAGLVAKPLGMLGFPGGRGSRRGGGSGADSGDDGEGGERRALLQFARGAPPGAPSAGASPAASPQRRP